jgi:hypothetical protein
MLNKKAFQRSTYKMLDRLAYIISMWNLEGNFVEYFEESIINYKTSK